MRAATSSVFATGGHDTRSEVPDYRFLPSSDVCLLTEPAGRLGRLVEGSERDPPQRYRDSQREAGEPYKHPQ